MFAFRLARRAFQASVTAQNLSTGASKGDVSSIAKRLEDTLSKAGYGVNSQAILGIRSAKDSYAKNQSDSVAKESDKRGTSFVKRLESTLSKGGFGTEFGPHNSMSSSLVSETSRASKRDSQPQEASLSDAELRVALLSPDLFNSQAIYGNCSSKDSWGKNQIDGGAEESDKGGTSFFRNLESTLSKAGFGTECNPDNSRSPTLGSRTSYSSKSDSKPQEVSVSDLDLQVALLSPDLFYYETVPKA